MDIAEKPSPETHATISRENGKTRIDYYSSRTMRNFVLHSDISPEEVSVFIDTIRTDAMLDAFLNGIKNKICNVI